MTKQVKQKKPIEWKIEDNRFVAFLDILGFKDMIMRKEHNEIYKKLFELTYLKIVAENKEHDEGSALHMFKDCDLHIVNFSDSIIVFTNTDNPLELKYLLITLVNILRIFLKNKVLVKGGIAHGKISVNKKHNIYFGQPIIDAYEMEENVNYLGVVAHNSIDSYIEENKLETDYDLGHYLVEAGAYFKSGGKISHKNLNYFWGAISDSNDNFYPRKKFNTEIPRIFKSLYTNTSGSPRRYIDNTLEFLKNLPEDAFSILDSDDPNEP